MADKTFIVSHPRARAPITVIGKDLDEALANEGLNPSIWKEVPPSEPTVEEPTGSTD